MDERALWVVLAGALTLRDGEAHEVRLSAIEAKVLSPEPGWVLVDATDDLELLEVVLPKASASSM